MLTKKFRLGELDEAAALLRRGELVAFPTETVYGLGAIATKEQAVAKVFKLKVVLAITHSLFMSRMPNKSWTMRQRYLNWLRI